MFVLNWSFSLDLSDEEDSEDVVSYTLMLLSID